MVVLWVITTTTNQLRPIMDTTAIPTIIININTTGAHRLHTQEDPPTAAAHIILTTPLLRFTTAIGGKLKILRRSVIML